jgi:glycosyltransferase involved in cell wall biosynthesis
MAAPLVSVVVPTARRPELLSRCLEALLAQDLPPDQYEVIVVDDAGCQATRRVVESCATARTDGPQFRYLLTAGCRGPAVARNLGWLAAHAPIIAFTDDDCVPCADWLRRGLAAFDGPAPIDGVAGRLVVPLPDRPTDYERDVANLEGAEFATANCFYRRSAIDAVGGFDERFPIAWREDSDLFFRMLEVDARLIHRPDAVVIHPVRPAAWGVSLRQQRKSMFNALLYKKHPRRYRQRVQAAPPWHYYAILASVVGLLVGFTRRDRVLQLGMAALWLSMTGRFCARRLRGTSRAPAHVAEMAVTSALIPPLSIFWRLRGAIRYRVWFL